MGEIHLPQLDVSMSDEDPTKSAPASLPVTWKANGQEYRGRPLVANVTKDEETFYARPRAQTCAECKNFRLQDGQDAMRRQRFLERLVLEETWKIKHLGSGPETYGFCNQSDALASMYAPACDHFRPSNGRLRIVR